MTFVCCALERSWKAWPFGRVCVVPGTTSSHTHCCLCVPFLTPRPLSMVLIEKHYRGFLNRSIADTFWKEVSARKAPKETPPVLQSDKYILAHVQHADLFVLSVIDDEMPALMAIDMMYRCLDIFKQYFGAVNADTLKKHFAIVYQLMDEVLDNGLPFNTEVSLLKEVISPPSFTDAIPLWTRKKNAVLPTWGADTSGAQVSQAYFGEREGKESVCVCDGSRMSRRFDFHFVVFLSLTLLWALLLLRRCCGASAASSTPPTKSTWM